MNKAIKVHEAAPDVLEVVTPKLRPVAIGDLVQQFPKMRAPVIDGLLRAGEVMNVIASPKVRKSWLVLLLAFSVMLGRKWLGLQCTAGRVLLIDNELHGETLAGRVRSVADALEENPGDQIDVLPVRGLNWDIVSLLEFVEDIQPGKYRLIVLDALYRLLPDGTSENDNAQMMRVYNTLDEVAKRTGAAIVVVHHSSKGDQAGKAQTDVGAGAGSIARAADCHLSIRPHAESDYFVLEASCRSFPPPDAKSIYFDMPLWYEAALEPELKQRKSSGEEKQQRTDTETREKLLALIKAKRMTASQLRGRTGFGAARVSRGLAQLLDAEEIELKNVRRRGSKRKLEIYQLREAVE